MTKNNLVPDNKGNLDVIVNGRVVKTFIKKPGFRRAALDWIAKQR